MAIASDVIYSFCLSLFFNFGNGCDDNDDDDDDDEFLSNKTFFFVV